MYKEVYPGIFLIKERGSLGVIKPPENIYVIAGHDGLIYDAGYGNKKTVKYTVSQIRKIEELYKSQNKPFKINRILPSHAHPDHISGLKQLREMLGLKILTTQKTAEIIKDKESFKKFFEPNRDSMLSVSNLRRRVKDWLQAHLWRFFYYRIYGLNFIKDLDELIEENSEILINDEKWKIFHSPGHSPDHISLYNEDKGLLFSGDNVLRAITTWLGPPHCSIDDYVKSVETIQKLPNLKLILASHGSPIENPNERIAEILDHRKERQQQVMDLVNKNSKTGISPSGIVNILYPDGNIVMQSTARGWVCLTLQKLEKNRLVKRVVGKKKIMFYPLDA